MSALLRNVGSALRSLREQSTRALLSAVGVAVGSAAIVLLISIAKGVQDDVTGQVRDLGVNVLVVVPGRLESGTFNPNFAGFSYLKSEDADALRKVDGVVRAEPFSFVGGGIRAGEKTAAPLLAACTPGWFAMRPVRMQEGRTFGDGDAATDVVVLGSIAKRELFGDGPALGREVTVNRRRYRVLGVTEDAKQESSLFSMGSFQNLVYLPYPRLKAVQPDLQTDRLMVQIRPEAEPKRLVRELDAALGRRLDRQQYQVLTQEDLLGLVYKLTGILTWLLTGLTSIALFVSGVGIMTVMLMSVNERRGEIGIRKTVGARRSDVFLQFLVEAVVLAVLGAAAGLLLAVAVCEGLRAFTPIKPLVTPSTVALDFGVCVGVGAVFGLLPALHASRKHPVDCLRQL